MNETLKTLLDKKAESNNTIDLNAYALGLEDGFNADNWIKVSDRLPELAKTTEYGKQSEPMLCIHSDGHHEDCISRFNRKTVQIP